MSGDRKAFDRREIVEGSVVAEALAEDPIRLRALTSLALMDLPAGPAEGEDGAAWASLEGLPSNVSGYSATDSVDIDMAELQAAPLAPAEESAEFMMPMAPQAVKAPVSRTWIWGTAVAGLLVIAGGFAMWKITETEPGTDRFDDLTQPASAASATPATAPTTTAPASAAPVVAAPTSAAPTSAAPNAAVSAPESAAPRSAGRSARRSARKPRSRVARAEDKPPAAAVAPRPAPAARPARAARPTEVDDLLGSLDGARSGKKPAARAGADPLLPTRLSRSDILRVVKKNAGMVRSCKNLDPSAAGNVLVGMVIGRDGRVTAANVKTAQFKGKPVGNCVSQKVKMFRFPQFSGDAMRINMPFGL